MNSKPPHVLVVGDGIAGTAAVFAALEAGAQVTLSAAGAGATALSSGAVDDVAWDEVLHAARTSGAELRAKALDPRVVAFSKALGIWRLPDLNEPLALLATTAGVVRPARGHDRALLDLSTIGSGQVAVPKVDRAGWESPLLASAWNTDGEMRRRGISFVSVDAALLRFEGEDRISDADLAARHDDPARISWLAARLHEALHRTTLRPAAVLLGPWLGLSSPRALELEKVLGIPCGEALMGVGGPAGMRLVRARDRWLQSVSVGRKGRTAELDLTRDDRGRPIVRFDGEDGEHTFDSVVLAVGGLTGGGIVYDPLDAQATTDMPDRYRPTFHLSVDIQANSEAEQPYFAAAGVRIGVVGSMFGPALDLSAWPSPGRLGRLEQIGIACNAEGRVAPHLAAAGNVVADRARTMLSAVMSGLKAGKWAATEFEA
ncbi:MAG: hypothetical protein IPK82_06685 [Polyangiaceae bacterium]|nr:hypothetical protein [Polyangiaceae bacterium]